jgi:dTDP-4-dehydrorhamnose reductase
MSGTERWLVTGGTGLLGSALRAAASNRGLATISLARSNASGGVRFDLCRLSQIPALLDGIQPTGVFHLAAFARPADVARNVPSAERLNIGATASIAEWCARRGVRLVFASTDWVFAGDRGPYREDDAPQPTTAYGKMKAIGERLCLDAGGSVARLSWILDDRPHGGTDFISRGLDRLRKGETVTAVGDERRTPISRSAAAEYLLDLRLWRDESIVHVAGENHTTPYDLLRQRAAALGLPVGRVAWGSACSLSPFGRPRDTRLDTSRLRSLVSRGVTDKAQALVSVA